MVDFGDQLEKIDDVDESDLEVWEEFSEESDGGERFVGRYIAARCHDNIWIGTLVIAGPVPYPEAFRAVLHGFVHVEELEMVLLVCDDDVDIVGASETMVRH